MLGLQVQICLTAVLVAACALVTRHETRDHDSAETAPKFGVRR